MQNIPHILTNPKKETHTRANKDTHICASVNRPSLVQIILTNDGFDFQWKFDISQYRDHFLPALMNVWRASWNIQTVLFGFGF